MVDPKPTRRQRPWVALATTKTEAHAERAQHGRQRKDTPAILLGELPSFLTKAEVAGRLRCSVRSVERMIKTRVFVPANHPARRVLIPREQLLLVEERMRRGDVIS